MTTVTKCYNSAMPSEEILFPQAKIELDALSKAYNKQLDGSDFFSDLMDYGEVTLTTVSYHLS